MAFGQYYARFGCINLARLAVHPGYRGQGVGRVLLRELMREAEQSLHLPEFGLFVYRDNEPAIRCYRSLGFRVTPHPRSAPLRDVTWYMTRSRGPAG